MERVDGYYVKYSHNPLGCFYTRENDPNTRVSTWLSLDTFENDPNTQVSTCLFMHLGQCYLKLQSTKCENNIVQLISLWN